jgi:DNA-binding NarL/FixJ family response regulator
MLRILIADDHEIVRRGVRDVLATQPGWEVCGEAADGRTAVEIGLREKPDVAILDVSLPLLNGIGVTRQLRQGVPKIEILLFTMHDD